MSFPRSFQLFFWQIISLACVSSETHNLQCVFAFLFVFYAPEWFAPGWGWGGGGGQPTGIRLNEVHVGREFDILNVPRVGNWLSRHLGKCRTWEWVIRGPPSWKIPSSHLDEFPTFLMGPFLQWRMAERNLEVSCCFEAWSFMTKSIFPSALRSNTWTKSHLKICFLLTCFHQMLPCHHPRRPRGSQSGREKRRDESFHSRGERAPGYRLSPNYFQTFKLMPAPDWAQKVICIIVPNQRTVSPEFFSWVRTWLLLPRSRLVWIMHQRDARSQETFSLM